MKITKFQEGGPMTAPAPAPAPAADPMTQMVEMAMAAIQNQDCELAMQVCDSLLMVLQETQPPVNAAPEGQPVFKKGGKMVGRNCKKKN